MYRNYIRHARAAAVVLALVPLLAAACSNDNNATSPTILPGAPFSTTDLVVGTGTEATTGRTANVFYTLWLYDPTKPDNKGTQYQTNVGGTPLSVQIGAQQTIPGFERGVTGMKVGGRRRIVVPPDLAYGSQGTSDGTIPPYATLIFEVELVSVQ